MSKAIQKATRKVLRNLCRIGLHRWMDSVAVPYVNGTMDLRPALSRPGPAWVILGGDPADDGRWCDRCVTLERGAK